MTFRIGTNVGSLASVNHLKGKTLLKELNLKQLASGDRIYQTAVDPSGLAISETMQAKLRSQDQSIRNINDGVSLFQTAEGSLAEIGNIGVRLKELAVRSANDSWNMNDRENMDQEFQKLKEEMDRISQTAEYNGRKLLDGSGINYEFQVGYLGDKVNRIVFDSKKLKTTNSNLGVSSAGLKSKSASQSAITSIDKMISKVSEKRAMLGSMSFRMESANNNAQTYRENTAASNSRIRDVDYAKASAEKAKLAVTTNATEAMLMHHNSNPQKAMKLI